MRLPVTLALLPILLVSSALGAETDWQTVAPGVTLRLVSAGPIKADGSTWLGLELNMPATTKTYWRIPGETGLPTELDFSGSRGLAANAIVWPYPERDQTERYVEYVYHGPLVLPVHLQLDAPTAQVEMSVVMGVCAEICVPAQAHFSLPLDGVKDLPNGLRIRQAVARAPIPWDNGPEPIGAVAYNGDDQMLAVHLVDPGLDASSIIVSTATGEPVFGAPQKGPQSDVILVPVLGNTDHADLENQPVQVTFITPMGAYEISRSVTLAD